MKNKSLFFISFTLILTFIIIFALSQTSFSAYPKLISKLINGFETIKEWIIKIATPAAAVAVRDRCFYEKIQFRR